MWLMGPNFAEEERGSAFLIADSSGIECWLRSGSWKIGIGRGDSQDEGMSLDAETC